MSFDKGKISANEDIMGCGDKEKIFLELKRISGWDAIGDMLDYNQFYEQYIQIKNELEFCPCAKVHPIKSVFEVGCGCGANLYLFQKDGMSIGGIDYSGAEIKIAERVLESPWELICDEAVNMISDVTYDAVLSNSVFSYFDSYEYAERVLESMYVKADYSIGIIDIHDIEKKDDFISYRKKTVSDYEERYKDLPKFFYEKSFFLKFAEKHDMDIRFSKSTMGDYWNNDFVFNCFMTKTDKSIQRG